MADVSQILASHQAKQKSTVVERDIPMELDVALMAVFDPNVLEDPISADREAYLQSQARDGVQTLVNALFSLPTTSTSEAVIANFPASGPITPLPRAKPLPKPAPLTKWQKFANDKGIAPKPKRDRMVFDEAKQEWVPRWGWKGKNKDEETAWIREVKPGEEDMEGGLERNPGKKARKERMLKNEKQRLKNIERAAAESSRSATASSFAKTSQPGSTTVGSKADNRARKIAENASKTAAEGAERRQQQSSRKREIDGLLQTTKKSTASMGKFDKTFEGEPKVKGQKRKFEPAEAPAKTERSNQLSVVERLAKDPTAFAEKAVKRGKKTKSSASAGTRGKAPEELVNARKAIRAVSGGKGAQAMLGGQRKAGKKGR